MVAVKSRSYAGESATERAARRRAVLVAAAFELIAAEGSAGLRIEKVCSRAGLNKRYFYESFADLDAVSVAVIDGLAAEAIAIALAAIDPDAPMPELVRGAVGALVHHLTDDPRRARVLFGEAAAGDAAARQRTESIREIVAVASAQGRALHQLGDEPVTDLAGSMIIGGSRQALMDFLDRRSYDDAEALADDLTAMWLAIGDTAAASTRGH